MSLTRAPFAVVAAALARAEARRNAAANDAMDFLYLGDDEGRHAAQCVHAETCSRDYDPAPYPEAVPDARLYDGTGIGALYGVPGGEHMLGQLAGWNLVPRTTR